jgi:alkanesulfonate monooxygenase SsuD/methylene tetrahydromethanopterin reductase-like flavin-dependent oxidoreductase (luciferase family)
MPAGMPVEQMRERVVQFREIIIENGRDFDQIDVAPQMITYVGKTYETAIERFQNSQMYNHLVSLRTSNLKDQAGAKYEQANLIGTAEDIIEKAKRFEEAGVKHLCGTYFCADTVDELLDQMQIFAEEVMPHIID